MLNYQRVSFFLRDIGMVCENLCETNLEKQVPYA